MKLHKIPLFLLAASGFCGIFHASASDVAFSNVSPLDTGKWVKFKISDSGVYEIGYESLREMGFDDPAKVGVCGGNGSSLDMNFFSDTGTPLYTDTYTPIATVHKGEKLYVYLTGASLYEFVSDSKYDIKGYYHRVSKNIYTDTPAYFLTDSAPFVKEAESKDISTAGAKNIYGGAGLLAHEEDLYHNNSNSGQLFWGEAFNNGYPSRRTFDYSLNGADTMTPALMECEIYVDQAADPSATYGYGAVGGSSNFSSKVKKYNYTNFFPQHPTVSAITLPSDKGRLFAEYQSSSNRNSVANLDFWTLTYSRTTPTLIARDGSTLPQEEFAASTIASGETGTLRLSVPEGCIALDITSPANVSLISLTGSSGALSGAVRNDGATPRVIVFNPASRQKEILSYTPITTASLHTAATTGAEFLIITTPDYRKHAERLAELHRVKDGIRVIVADAEDVYNEFSQGNPDPMAYRALVRMIWQGSGKALQNVLLFGPVCNNLRTLVASGGNDCNALIAYQSVNTLVESGAYNINDYYGIMADYIDPSNSPVCRLDVGVGLLPIDNYHEADNIVNKIDRYLNDTDHSYGVNDNTIVAGLYDRHMHGTHALNLYDVISRGKKGSVIPEIIAIDAYGEVNARSKFISAIDRGASVISYIGHGAQTMLGKNTKFFNLSDVRSLRNHTLPFLTVAGCEISNIDRGERGIGDSFILSTPYGVVGGIVATRDTWAMQNLALMRNFYLALYKQGSSPTPSSDDVIEQQTIGQVFARAKSANATENKYAYQLVSDPALKIATAMRKINVTVPPTGVVPGQLVKISLEVLDADGNPDTDYNGTAVVKLMSPVEQRVSQDLVTNTLQQDKIELKIYYTDNYSTSHVEVKDGKATANIFVPYSLSANTGEQFTFHAGAFDNGRWIGAAGNTAATIAPSTSVSSPLSDRDAPSITRFEYNPELNTLELEVSDNRGLYTGETAPEDYLRVMLDGDVLSEATAFPAKVSADGLSISRTIPLRTLSRSSHSAYVAIKDCAGNETTAETVFSTDRPMADVKISLTQDAAWTKAVFKVEGNYNASSRIVIVDSKWHRIAVRAIRGEETEWNLTDTDGVKVAPGMYKAYVEVPANNGMVTVSEKIDVPIV